MLVMQHSRKQDNNDVFELMKEYFDEATKNLPACSSILAGVRQQYDRVLQYVERASKSTTAVAYRTHIHQTEVSTICNYKIRLKELKTKMGIVETDNSRIRSEIKKMRKERETLSKERELKVNVIKEQQLQLVCQRRQALQLSASHATNPFLLKQQLEAVRKQVQEAEELTETMYMPAERKHKFQQQQKQVEGGNQVLTSENAILTAQLKYLRKAVEGAKSYSVQVGNGHIDTSEMDITTYILLATGSQSEDERELTCSEGEAEDPLHDQEAEVILNSFEKFNLLFQNKLYKEAALQATTSPKGALRTLETLQQFKESSNGHKLPLLLYCEALMESSPAFKPISTEEALECTICALKHGELKALSHWIAQEWLPSSIEVASAIFHHCQCKERCICGCKIMAFTVFERCGAIKQAALCLLHQERYISFLWYAKKSNFSLQDYEIMLCSAPSIGLGRCLTMPPHPYQPLLTVAEGMQLLLHVHCAKIAAHLLQDYLKHHAISLSTAIIQDKSTSREQWEYLISGLMEAGQESVGLDIFAAVTVSVALHCAIHSLQQELTYPVEQLLKSNQHHSHSHQESLESQCQSQNSSCSVLASPMGSSCTSDLTDSYTSSETD